MRIELDGLTIDVEANGVKPQPWGDGSNAYAYVVTVDADGGLTYETPAYGSQMDYGKGQGHEAAAEDIGWMVLRELADAAYDPDEFFEIATSGEGGRHRAADVLAMIATAEAMLPAIERNEEAMQDQEDRL